MKITIVNKENQAFGVFAGGLIKENKPIGFPQDGGHVKPYSNLFYWANAWSEKGGVIDEHPHKMFEIISIVIDGKIEHYDNKSKKWFFLKKGDAQIIRAGKGITHAEKLNENSRIFQIWFDPNIKETINHEASYNDYKSDEIKSFESNGMIYRNYTGSGGPINMHSEGVQINEIIIKPGIYQLKLGVNNIYSYYVVKGNIELNNKNVVEDDYIKIENAEEIKINTNNKLVLFEIITPKQLSYKTYNELTSFKR